MAARDKIKALLRTGACTDAKHDFKEMKGGFFDILLAGLPDGTAPDLSSLNEPALLKNLHKYFEGDRTPIQNLMKNLGATHTGSMTIKGYKEENDYAVSILKHRGNINVQDMIDLKGGNLTIKEFKDFFDTKNTVNFIIDAMSFKLMELISTLKGDKGEKVNINLIINRESLNDPATKITEFIKPSSGVSGKILYDRSSNPIVYPHIATKTGYENFFYSKFDFILGPLLLEQSGPKGIIKSSLRNVEIRNPVNKQLVTTIENPKEFNTINTVWKYIESIFQDDSLKLKASAAFQAKRSGDWLQTLSSMDTSRIYASPSDGKIHKLDGEIILVTHDRVLLWYSLIMGINVVFTTKEHEVAKDETRSKKYMIYFKNKREREYNVASIKGNKYIGSVLHLNVVWEGYEDLGDWWQEAKTLSHIELVKEYMKTIPPATSSVNSSNMNQNSDSKNSDITRIEKYLESTKYNEVKTYMENYIVWQKAEFDKVILGIDDKDYVKAMKSFVYLYSQSIYNLTNTLAEFQEAVTKFNNNKTSETAKNIDDLKVHIEGFMEEYPTQEAVAYRADVDVVDPNLLLSELSVAQKGQILAFVNTVKGGIREEFVETFQQFIENLHKVLGDTKAIHVYMSALHVVDEQSSIVDILESAIIEPVPGPFSIVQMLKDASYLLFFANTVQNGGHKRPRNNNNNSNNMNNVNNTNNINTRKSKKSRFDSLKQNTKLFILANYLRELQLLFLEIDFASDPDTEYYETFISHLYGLFTKYKTIDEQLYIVYEYMPERSYLGRLLALHSLNIDSADEDIFVGYFPPFIPSDYLPRPIIGKVNILAWCKGIIKILINKAHDIRAPSTPPRGTPPKTRKRVNYPVSFKRGTSKYYGNTRRLHSTIRR
jgi:hypothetical protein